MAPMLALLGDVLITPLSHKRHSDVTNTTFATVHVLCDDVKFCDGPGILHAKSCIHVLTPHELPCYGFCSVKTWLFIVYDTVFYA